MDFAASFILSNQHKNKMIQFFSLLAVIFSGCAKDTSQSYIDNASQFKISRRFDAITPSSPSSIQVYNELNEPVIGAKILIGTDLNTPFQGNLFTTDNQGAVSIGDAWNTQEHITIIANGYIRQTLLNQKPGLFQIKLHKIYKNPRPVIKGQVTQLPVDNGDKKIDFGLVIPTVSKEDFLTFSLDSVISPYDDKITIVGNEVRLPSNVSLPKQKENYILPITLEKSEHRVYATNYGTKTFFALTGRFPFKPVVSELKDGKKFFEILNLFEFNSGSLREVNIANAVTQLNIPANEIKFPGQISIRGAKIQADEVQVALALNNLSGQYVPSDVKRINANESLNLKAMSDKPMFVVSLLRKQADFNPQTMNADQSSASMLAYQPNLQTSLLPLINAPSVEKLASSYKVRLPAGPQYDLNAEKVNPIAISVTISNAIEMKTGDQTVTIYDRQWEIYGTHWPSDFTLPNIPLEPGNQKRRLDLNMIGSQTDSEIDLGDDLINAATHVTHSAVDL